MKRWLRNFVHAPARSQDQRRLRSFRPKLESLEERTVPTVTYHGGALLPNVQVQGVYYGDQWQNDPTFAAQAGYLEGYLSTIVNSPYMDVLTATGYNVGRGSSSPGTVNATTLASGSTVTDTTIHNYLNSAITAGTLQPITANSLYVVFVERNVIVSMSGGDSRSFRGYHGAYAGPGGAAVRYAVVAYPRGTVNNAAVDFLADIDSITKTCSHEIAEAATDPDVNFRTGGWVDSSGGEIGDVNNDRVATLGGTPYVIQRVIDQADHNMTPGGAVANASINFVLRSDGTFYKNVGGVLTLLSSGIRSLSDQSIDTEGHVMVDVVDTTGTAKEWHDVTGFVTVRQGALAAVAAPGASYVLGTDGTVYGFDDSTRATTTLDHNATAISAGTDKAGINTVGIVHADGTATYRSDTSGAHNLASNVASISVGQVGSITYVTTGDAGFLYDQASNQTTSLGGNITKMSAGTDEGGRLLLAILYEDGSVYQYSTSTGIWSGVWTDTADAQILSLGKGRLGTLNLLFSWTYAFTHDSTGFTPLDSNDIATA